jgi:predicted ATP-dependent serine protease
MDQALRVECSDEIDEAASSPREEVLLRELDEKMKNISEVVDGVKAAVSAIPDIQDDMEQIKRTLAELVSYSKSIVMALGSSAKGGPLSGDKISKHLLPVSTVFTAEC